MAAAQAAVQAAAQVALANFALAPALVDNDVIDYSTAAGAKLYAKATEPLKDLYDGNESDLGLFLQQVRTRAEVFGWNHILAVPPDLANPDETVDLILHYGELSLEQVRAFAQTWFNNQSRAAQDDAQLYHCLRKSLTKEAETNIVLFQEDYIIGDRSCGLALLKVIVREAYVDTNATILHIREQLNSLDLHIVKLGYHIEKFNAKVKTYQRGLAARGASTSDLLSNLFKAYKAVPDVEFTDYIRYHETRYDDGETITPERLMHLALNKYKMRVEKNLWNAPTEEQAKIIALEAQLEKFIKARGKQQSGSGKPGISNKGKGKQGNKGQDGQPYVKPAWMKVAPKQGESTKKTVDSKIYWWCTNHKSWCRHSTDKCKGRNLKQRPQQTNNASEGETGDNNPTLQLSEALAHLAEAESETDD
jgi:hypothetical protein